MSHTDSSFYKVCGAVMGLLVLFTLFIMFVANTWSPDSQEDPLAAAKRERQIAPVGRSRVAEAVDSDAASTGDAATATATAEVAAPAAEVTEAKVTEEAAAEEVAVAKVESAEVETAEGTAATAVATVATDIPNKVKATVDSVCAACHVSGIANAPKYGDAAAWDARMAKGLDAVTASAIAGIGAMPARGGSSLNDEEMRLAVQYLLTK